MLESSRIASSTEQTHALSRRSFLKRSGLALGVPAIGAATLSSLAAHTTWAAEGGAHGPASTHARASSCYGELFPAPDQNGQAVLALPRDFRYVTFSKTGTTMLDGTICPRNHDGMGAFEGPGQTVRLIRNHELRNAAGDFTLGVLGPVATRYDSQGMAGTVTIDFDPRTRRVVREFVSLNGTIVNCAGGLAYRGAGWITCEETTNGVKNGFSQPHGYTFLVPANANATVPAIALKWMGRFAHEAAVSDGAGVLYQTEDAGKTRGSTARSPTTFATWKPVGDCRCLPSGICPPRRCTPDRWLADGFP
jgi:uncharacterized protein